jgi:hypothetical protein
LRLKDVGALDLESEEVFLGNVSPHKLRDRLRRNGASAEEIGFLISGRRVELNAMTSDQLIEFVEGKLTEHGITKGVPAKDMLNEAFRLFARGKLVEEAVERVIKEMPTDMIAVPDDLDARVIDYLDENPESPWEAAVRYVALEIGGTP